MSTVAPERHKLDPPPLDELANALSDGLARFFADVLVEVVDCPDLTAAPFGCAFSALGGDPCIIDVGGVDNLFPCARRGKYFDLSAIEQQIGAGRSCFIGAGAGPFQEVQHNCEWICNVRLPEANESRCAVMEGTDKGSGYTIERPKTTCFGILGNLYACKGEPCKVLHIKAGRRTGKDPSGKDLPQCLASILASSFPSRPVSLGGVMAMHAGKARLHIMSDFTDDPIRSNDAIENWLNYFEVPAPMTFMFVSTSIDPGMDLRTVHTHGWHEGKYGGHYHNDTTPDEVSYEVYVNVAECIYRIDRVSQTPDFNRPC
ncbi:unnamed protein product [Vitrella brassicaformis CCMP3155]|uniref:DUF1907 domain-containing protein n=1 Tax=Vitrella brassicaformis (strain CCMP3155) TaxID=1169540 RepID=A0A0G4GDI3_VITBC|nr:unnamed protein product [Vitrella brassicaformis CCMP3155]|eukprot:CEM27452.1 unnamed protein product [Vitrella brassicaformis CCMP3155]